MGLQRVGHDWATELNWNDLNWTISPYLSIYYTYNYLYLYVTYTPISLFLSLPESMCLPVYLPLCHVSSYHLSFLCFLSVFIYVSFTLSVSIYLPTYHLSIYYLSFLFYWLYLQMAKKKLTTELSKRSLGYFIKHNNHAEWQKAFLNSNGKCFVIPKSLLQPWNKS